MMTQWNKISQDDIQSVTLCNRETYIAKVSIVLTVLRLATETRFAHLLEKGSPSTVLFPFQFMRLFLGVVLPKSTPFFQKEKCVESLLS